MTTYKITPAGDGFQVTEIDAEAGTRTLGPFPTMAVARSWLISHLSLLNQDETTDRINARTAGSGHI